MAKNVLVYVEQRGGKTLPATFQLMYVAKQLADGLGGSVEACIIGSGITSLADGIAACGASKVYLADDAELEHYRVMPYTTALVAAIDAAAPKIVVMPTTALGRDLASRVAARKRAALCIDCIHVELQGDDLIATKTMYAGKLFGKFRLSASRLQVVTVRSNVYPAAQPQDGAAAETVSIAPALRPEDVRLKLDEIASTSRGVKDVTEADVVVSGGRSLKSEENFKIIFELAEVLEGAVGASRAACDAGYQPHGRQVGLTGKVVTPALYIACGIDGAIQHLAGMRGSKVIVAINTKAEAPIFKVANYGCVADLFVLVPLLTREFKKLMS
ncbi:MAG: electron transfer flavoprotein subunit alpha/FixB family protein [Phycisphaerae bacterium]